MLRKDVVEAAAAGKFHIYPVRTIDQGAEILTGVPRGEEPGGGLSCGDDQLLSGSKAPGGGAKNEGLWRERKRRIRKWKNECWNSGVRSGESPTPWFK